MELEMLPTAATDSGFWEVEDGLWELPLGVSKSSCGPRLHANRSPVAGHWHWWDRLHVHAGEVHSAEATCISRSGQAGSDYAIQPKLNSNRTIFRPCTDRVPPLAKRNAILRNASGHARRRREPNWF